MSIEFINPPGMSVGSYSHAVGIDLPGGRLVLLSGQVAMDAAGAVTASTFEGQVEQVFDALTTVLGASGARWTDVLKLNVYLCDITPERVRVFREIRTRRLAGHKPASTLVGTSGLVHADLMLEVEATVFIPEGAQR